MYQGAKVGQVVYYSRHPWEEREAVKVHSIYKSHRYLVNPNSAIVMLGDRFDFPVHVSIHNIYRKAEK